MDVSVQTAGPVFTSGTIHLVMARQEGAQGLSHRLPCNSLKGALYRHMPLSEGGYPIKGTDTLTIGGQEDWLLRKLIAEWSCKVP